MTPLFAKLNLQDQTEIVVLDAPASFEPELKKLKGVRVHRSLSGVKSATFALAFVQKQAEVDAIGPALTKKLEGDAILWMAYPKGSSKRYTSEINRDHGWRVLGAAGFEGMRMVAIDEDWSGLRFRRREFIKRS